VASALVRHAQRNWAHRSAAVAVEA
jgi:hypothetical protein